MRHFLIIAYFYLFILDPYPNEKVVLILCVISSFSKPVDVSESFNISRVYKLYLVPERPYFVQKAAHLDVFVLILLFYVFWLFPSFVSCAGDGLFIKIFAFCFLFN